MDIVKHGVEKLCLQSSERRYSACAAVVGAGVSLYVVMKMLRSRPDRFAEVPGSFLLGVLNQLGPNFRDFAKKLDEWAAKHGQEGVYEMNLAGARSVVICDWDIAQKVLALRPLRVQKPKIMKQLGDLSTGVFFSEGSQWKRERRLMAPAFNVKNVDTYAPGIHEVTDVFLSKLEEASREGRAANFSDLLLRLTAQVIVKVSTGFDYPILNDDDSRIVEANNTFINGLMTRMFALFPYWNIPGLGNLIDGADAASERIAGLMTHAMNQTAGNGTTIVDRLRESQGESMSHHELMGNLRVLFVAGMDTTSKALSWAFYYLSKDQELQERVASEVKHLPEDALSIEQLDSFSLVGAVWRETLRVRGPAPFDTFNSDEHLTIAGRSVPPGTDIYVNYRYILHSEPKLKEVLGADLDEFRPARWLAADGSVIKAPPFDSLSFGHGPRICLGMRLADYEGRLVLARVLKNFRLLPWQGPDMAEKMTFVLEPAEEVNISLARRV